VCTSSPPLPLPFLPSLFSDKSVLRYGGPHSQTVDLRFSRDWHEYIACALEYIVVVVDGRGTGFKGRKLRNPVKGNLGYWETVDQVNAARCVLLFFLVGWMGGRVGLDRWGMVE
jgi:hypothetical protein